MSQSEWNSNQIEDPGAGALGEGAGEERVSKFKPNINTSTLTLVACFIAAIVVLYLLGLQNKPRAASASELAANTALDQQIKDALHFSDDPKYSDTMKNIGDLAKRLTNIGIDDETVAQWDRNPFEQIIAAAPPPPRPPGGDNNAVIPALPPLVDPNVRLAEQEYLGLRLQIVMMGVSNSALINNVVVQKGTHFKYLVVDEIKPGEVVLKYTDKDKKDWPFELKSEPQQPNRN